jgi:hypothetical protein
MPHKRKQRCRRLDLQKHPSVKFLPLRLLQPSSPISETQEIYLSCRGGLSLSIMLRSFRFYLLVIWVIWDQRKSTPDPSAGVETREDGCDAAHFGITSSQFQSTRICYRPAIALLSPCYRQFAGANFFVPLTRFDYPYRAVNPFCHVQQQRQANVVQELIVRIARNSSVQKH